MKTLIIVSVIFILVVVICLLGACLVNRTKTWIVNDIPSDNVPSNNTTLGPIKKVDSTFGGYDPNLIYSGEKRNIKGNIIAIIKGQLIDLNKEFDRAILKDNKGQYHAVSCSLKTVKN